MQARSKVQAEGGGQVKGRGHAQGRRRAVRLSVALLVLAAGYVGLALVLGRQVPANTTVDGVEIGGKSSQEAKVALEGALATKAAAPVTLEAPGNRTAKLDPVVAGLSLDLDRTLSGLSGFSLSPATLWAHRSGGSQPLLVEVDEAKLGAALTQAARSVDGPVKEGSISFAGGKVTSTQSAPGHRLRVSETAAAIAAAWPRQPRIKAVVAVIEPRLAASEIARATKEFAIPAMSGPVKVTAGSTIITLSPARLAPAISVTADEVGKLAPALDGAKLVAALRAAAPGVERKPVDARVRLAGGRPAVVPATVGVAFDPKTAPAAVLPALTSSRRTARVALLAAQPKVTTATARSWKVTSVVSSFSSAFPVSASTAARTHNIRTAVARLNGVFIKPGESFSLNGILGERTPAKGYRQAPVIYAGRLTKDYGGGVSQVSTTVFNTAFFAGVRIDEHTPHSFYISRYPEGREATVSWPDVDNRWTNDSGYGILVQAAVVGDEIRMTFWGTKVWDIEAVKGPRRNVVQPRNITDGRPSCVPQSPSVGFDVTVTRIFKRNGARVKSTQLNTHYIPEDHVTCTHPSAG